jgi:three-Cys-motif partner protein
MLTEHTFGGSWTEDKLERIRHYLEAYALIFDRNERARNLATTYVDAFAGTGRRADARDPADYESLLFEDAIRDADVQSLKEGSARVALTVEPGFGSYVFVDRNPEHARQLERLEEEFPDKAGKIFIEVADANYYLKDWCDRTDWSSNRAVVFLDPYGMQVDWSTIEAIAGTEAIDLWVLFPLGQAVNRLLARRRVPEGAQAERLTRSFGTEAWRETFYCAPDQPSIFEDLQEEEGLLKSASLQAIGEFFVDRLRTVFAGVAPNPLSLRNSRNVPIYLLCFAAGNPRGAPTAVRIAHHLLRR